MSNKQSPLERLLHGDERSGAWTLDVPASEQKALLWGGPEYGSWDSGYGQNSWGNSTYSLNNYSAVDWQVEAGDPLQSSIIMACVGWITTNFATAPVVVNRLTANGKEPQVNHPLTAKLARPNANYPGALLWDPTLLSFSVAGNAYWLKERNSQNRVISLRYWPHTRIRARSDNGEYISYYELYYSGDWNRISTQDVVHFRNGLNPTDVRYGLSPLAPALIEMAMDNEAGRYSFYILRNMGIPGAVISPVGDYEILPDAAARIKADFAAKFTGSRRGEAMVLNGPMNVVQPAFSPADMNADALRTKPEERIAALLGIPPMVVGLGAGLAHSTYNNNREAYAAAYRNNIIPTQSMMADTLDVQLLPDFTTRTDETLDFDTSNVQELQESEDAKVTRAVALYGGMVATLNEARAKAGLSNLGPEGDVFKQAPALFGAPAMPGKSYRPIVVSLPELKQLSAGKASRASLQSKFERDAAGWYKDLLQEALDEHSGKTLATRSNGHMDAL